MSHSYSPEAAYSQMDENKQDLPKKLVSPLARAVSLSRQGMRPSLYLKGGGFREKGQKWRWRGLGGGSVGAGGVVQAKESPVMRVGSFTLSGSPVWLSDGAICRVCSLWAPPGC